MEGYQSLLMSRKIFGNLNSNITEQFQKVLLRIRPGEIKDIIQTDGLIIDYGNGYAFKYQSSDHYGKMIRVRVLLLARMLHIASCIKRKDREGRQDAVEFKEL